MAARRLVHGQMAVKSGGRGTCSATRAAASTTPAREAASCSSYVMSSCAEMRHDDEAKEEKMIVCDMGRYGEIRGDQGRCATATRRRRRR